MSALSKKFIRGFILAAVLIIGVSCAIGYNQYKTTVEKQYNNMAYHIADVVISMLDGDTVERYLETKIMDEQYEIALDKITQLRKDMDVHYIFVAGLEGIFLEYVFDADNPDDSLPQFRLGDVGDINTDFEEEITKVAKTGIRSDNYFYSDSEFGFNMTSFTPLYNSKQEIIALVGVEVSVDIIKDTLWNYIVNAVGLSAVIILLIMIVFLRYINKTVSDPIRILTKNAEQFVTLGNEFTDEVKQIKTKDEIENLAKSFLKMESDIKQYVENLQKVTFEKKKIEAELDIASQIQNSILPNVFPIFPDRKEMDIYASMTASLEVGGDFYDIFEVNEDHYAFVMADVSGKGIPASLFMMTSKTLIKTYLQSEKELNQVVTDVNNILCDGNDVGMFVTAFISILELSTGKFTYVNAGHNPPVVKKSSGEMIYINTKPNLVLGAMKGIEYKKYDMLLEDGDLFFAYTDGVTEALNQDNELYGTDRMEQVIDCFQDPGVNVLLEVMLADVNQFANGVEQADDITMLVMKYHQQDRNGKIV